MYKSKESDFTSTIERYSATLERVKSLGDKAAKAGAFTLEESATMFSDLFSLKDLINSLQPAPSTEEDSNRVRPIPHAETHPDDLEVGCDPTPCKD